MSDYTGNGDLGTDFFGLFRKFHFGDGSLDEDVEMGVKNCGDNYEPTISDKMEAAYIECVHPGPSALSGLVKITDIRTERPDLFDLEGSTRIEISPANDNLKENNYKPKKE